MTDTNRGLNLSDVTSVTGPEREEFGAFYASILGHTHRGLDYLLDQDPATLKRYRHYSNVATPNNYESERKVFVFGFLPFYAVTGYDVGVRYLIHTRQKMGLTKAQILEGIAISFLVMGPPRSPPAWTSATRACRRRNCAPYKTGTRAPWARSRRT